MFNMILLVALAVSPKASTFATPVVLYDTVIEKTTDIGLYSVKNGQMSPETMKANFKNQLMRQNAEYQNTGGSLSVPWKNIGELKDNRTWLALTRITPEWRYTDSENTIWVYQAPDFGNNWPTKVLQIADKSTAIGYNVEVTSHCSETEAECTAYFATQKSMLAPRPNGLQSEPAYKQWLNRIKQEACVVLPANTFSPRYPPQALRDGIGGTVRVGFIYNACGNVRDTWIVTSSRNRDLDRAALNGALKWQIDTSSLPNKGKSGTAIAPVVFSAD